MLVVGGREQRGDGAGFVRFAGLGDEFVEPAQKLGRKPTGFSGFLASSHGPNSVPEPDTSATLKLHFVPPGFRPKSSICNLISEIALLTLSRPLEPSQSACESGFHEAFEKPFDKPLDEHFERPSEQPFDMAVETAFERPFEMALEMASAVALQVALVLASPKPLVEPPPVASGIAFLCADQVGDIGAGEMPAP